MKTVIKKPSLPSLFFQWKVPPSSKTEIITAQVIIIHEFGNMKWPSIAIKLLAKRAAALAKQYDIPVIAQYPSNSVLIEHGVTPVLVIDHNISHPGDHLDTQEVDSQVNELCQEKGWQRVLIMAHPDHVWRVVENIKSFGLIPIIPDCLDDIPYDKNSGRLAVSYWWIWKPREIAIVRPMYYLKGYLGEKQMSGST